MKSENTYKNTSNKTLDIIFTGDIAFTRYLEGKYTDEKLCSKEIMDFLSSGNEVIANVECALTATNDTTKASLKHFASTKVSTALNRMNVSVWNLGNNHIMDYGVEGLDDTLKAAKDNNVRTIGVGHNKEEAKSTIIIDNGVKVGILSVTKYWKSLDISQNIPGTICYYDIDTIKSQIDELKSKKVDYIVAIIHCGEEFSSMPIPLDRNRYINILDLGVDIIVGHHPHVVQNYEEIGEKTIFYSLGNFIFDTDYQRIQNNTDVGVLLKLKFSKSGYTFEYIATKIDRENCKISTCSVPTIFTNIDEKAYKSLWPFAARQFVKNNKKANLYKNPKFYDMNIFRKISMCYYIFKDSKWGEIHRAKILSYFYIKKSKYKELYNYILEK